MSWNDVENFLSKVLADPPSNGGFANLHYAFIPQTGLIPAKLPVTGKAFKTIHDLVGMAKFMSGRTNFRDIWFCTSIQSQTKLSATGKLQAVRGNAFSTALKAIWYDVDVDPADTTGKHYRSIDEAWSALVEFRKAAGLPAFSAVVRSGGGLQVYYIAREAMSPDVWLPYAEGFKAIGVKHGLKFDAGLTTDNCRLLRVPNTFNYKYTPPRQVGLLPLPLVEYDFATVAPFNGFPALAPVATTSSGVTASDFFDVGLFPRGAAAGAFKTTLTPSLAKGLERDPLPPANPRPIFEKCAFFKHALLTGGRDYDNPLWNLSLLGAAFMANGATVAHEISKGHPKYTHAETQAQFERKLKDRADRDIGWPSCAAIEANGCKSCASCPLKGAITSPISLGNEPVTAPVKPSEQPSTDAAQQILDWVPKGHVVKNGIVYAVVIQESRKKDEPAREVLKQVFDCTFENPWASGAGTEKSAINFTASMALDNKKACSVPQAIFGNLNELCKNLNLQGVKYNAKGKLCLENFFMSLLSKLHSMRDAPDQSRYGWQYENGQLTGFSYGGRVFGSDGSESQAIVGDHRLRASYMPTGDVSHWYKACAMVMGEQRPELDAIIAASFASPLVGHTDKGCCVLSAVGLGGERKSAAMTVGLSIWGNPLTTKEVPTATQNGMFGRLGEVSVLPSYWDEITEDHIIPRMANIIMEITQAVEKTRMNSDTTMRYRGTWSACLITAGNRSVVDYMYSKTTEHQANVHRVFEYPIARVTNGPGVISDTDAGANLRMLAHNYGGVGLKYAKVLGHKLPLVKKLVETCQKQVEQDCKIVPEERYWKTTMGLILAGAALASEIGVNFNVPRLQKFLYEALEHNRRKRADHIIVSSADGAEDILDSYLKARMMQQTIWCDRAAPRRQGAKQIITMLHAPDNRSTVLPVVVRFDVEDRQLHISQKDFRRYVEEIHKTSYDVVFRSLAKAFGATIPKVRYTLASGTRFASMSERLIDIPILPHTSLEEMANNWGDVAIASGQSLATGITGTQPVTAPVKAGGVAGTPITAKIMEQVNADHRQTGS